MSYTVTYANSGRLCFYSVLLSEAVGIPFINRIASSWTPAEDKASWKFATWLYQPGNAPWGLAVWAQNFPSLTEEPLHHPELQDQAKKEIMQSRSRGCMWTLSAPGALLSLHKHRLVPITLWLNIYFTSKFVLGRGNTVLSKQKIA